MFAQWLISEWVLQFVWAEALPVKLPTKQEEKKEEEALILIPNSNLAND